MLLKPVLEVEQQSDEADKPAARGKNRTKQVLALLVVAALVRYFLVGWMSDEHSLVLRLLVVLVIMGVGALFVLRKTAKVIEETTEVLSERTKLAGGLLQSLGTAFPDMVLGIIAAIISLSLAESDYGRAISFAIIAAATTFGSNIYNVAHATWCVWQQNRANVTDKARQMFPGIARGGMVRPLREHATKPSLKEMDTAIDISGSLTILTAIVALSMVIFGKVDGQAAGIEGDLYQLIRPVGVVILVMAVFVLYRFRKTERAVSETGPVAEAESYYRRSSAGMIWLHLLLSGGAILLAADSMVRAIEVFSEIAGIPFVVAGVAAGLIGCLGEMIVVHNFTVNPKGRIGDAVVGVAMDNIVTTVGAAIVAVMGGIFLGGNALILIFVIILALNSVLIVQISKLKNYLF